MRQARYIVRKADGVGGDPIPDDEPCIVIRGQDKLAVDAIEFYIQRYSTLPEFVFDQQVLNELRQHRDAIFVWQLDHPTKWADR